MGRMSKDFESLPRLLALQAQVVATHGRLLCHLGPVRLTQCPLGVPNLENELVPLMNQDVSPVAVLAPTLRCTAKSQLLSGFV